MQPSLLIVIICISFSLAADHNNDGNIKTFTVELDRKQISFPYTTSNVHRAAAEFAFSSGLCSPSLPIVDCPALHIVFVDLLEQDLDLRELTRELAINAPGLCTPPTGDPLPPTLSPVFEPSSPSPSRSDLARVSLVWEILSALQLAWDPTPPPGRIRPVQLVALLSALDAAGPEALYCEVGLNGGHSAGAVLAARAKARVLAFDLAAFPFSEPVAEFLTVTFNGRFEVVWGDSKVTVPLFSANRTAANTEGRKCDVIFVDGGHEYEDITADIHNLRELAHSKTVLFFDDTQPKLTVESLWTEFLIASAKNSQLGFPGTAARNAVLDAILEGLIEDTTVFHDYSSWEPCNPEVGGERFTWGWAEGRYKL